MLPAVATSECDTNPGEDLETPSSPFLGQPTRSGILISLPLVVNEIDSIPTNIDTFNKELLLGVSGKALEFEGLRKFTEESNEGFHLRKNYDSLIQRSLEVLGGLNTFKLFGREVSSLSNKGKSLQIITPSSSVVEDLELLKSVMELELERFPASFSKLSILNKTMRFKCVTKISLCSVSISHLPSEVGCLKNLKILDLSFNKLERLPLETYCLPSLVWLSLSNNKLSNLSSRFSMLHQLEYLDLSNNRLTSIDSIELNLLPNLHYLNLQNNKLLKFSQFPEWVRDLEEEEANTTSYDRLSSSVEMEIYSIQESNVDSCSIGLNTPLPNQLLKSPSNSERSSARTSLNRWKKNDYLLQKSRQERLNISRKWKNDGSAEVTTNRDKDSNKSCNPNPQILDDDLISEISCDFIPTNIFDSEDSGHEESLASTNESDGVDLFSCAESIPVTNKSCCFAKTSTSLKRQSDGEVINPKSHKFQKASSEYSALSRKYNEFSFCGISDYLSDGFYDAGRDRPFMPLSTYEHNFYLDSREVILLDREKDEELDALVLSAQSHVSHMKKHLMIAGNLQVVSWLALFVSDHFGGSDRASCVELARKASSSSNYDKPFVCTCSSGTRETLEHLSSVEHCNFADLCEQSLQFIKRKKSSIIVPLGSLRFGVCRHRALLLKYLCDRMKPSIPCELVRGYLDFFPHAWNIIPVKKAGSFVRMVVDACSPLQIREENNSEFLCRYIPLNRLNHLTSFSLFSRPLNFDEISKSVSKSIIKCKMGSVDVAVKIRNLEVSSSCRDEVRAFELTFLGEVRILTSLRHPSIVEVYGHKITSNWVPSENRRTLQSAIFMEYIEGGSLKSFIDDSEKSGMKRLPANMALFIAKQVAWALTELHAKDIIHRDIKSENILFSLENGRPVVKLCDFDRAVPLRSHLHRCCIGHLGNPPPNVCVGTPRWMAPEVLRAFHRRDFYGLEVDIWSYGCLLFELLTLQVPYFDVPEWRIRERIEAGKRPRLSDELEAVGACHVDEKSGFRFLVSLFVRCTEALPEKRPSASEVYRSLKERVIE